MCKCAVEFILNGDARNTNNLWGKYRGMWYNSLEKYQIQSRKKKSSSEKIELL